ncbi:hypothetical protein H312_00433 [Anncaliia algerae PRA339]|uniref:Uncharacterized protein n=1 Tax=Anncaliia algerae PRA339 TaxID=1288291 RepID=A0A059F5D5_9MICR|nr:hypothetical protein H312_00433 [Anncaliia algerae PRA339]
MQSFSKNPLVGIVSCIIAFAVIITIAIVKVKYYPDEDGASVSTTETTVTTPEQQKITEEKAELKESKEVPKKKEKKKPKEAEIKESGEESETETEEEEEKKEKAKEKKEKTQEVKPDAEYLKAYSPIYNVFKVLEADKQYFKNLKCKGSKEISGFFENLEKFHTDIPAFKKMADKILKIIVEGADIEPDTIKDSPQILIGQLFETIIKGEIGVKSTLKELLESDFVKNFSIIREGTKGKKTYYYCDSVVNTVLLEKIDVTINDKMIDVTIAEQKKKYNKIVYVPPCLVVIFDDGEIASKKYSLDVNYIKSSTKFLRLTKEDLAKNKTVLEYDFKNITKINKGKKGMSMFAKDDQGLKYYINGKEKDLPADDTKIYPAILLCKSEEVPPKQKSWLGWIAGKFGLGS